MAGFRWRRRSFDSDGLPNHQSQPREMRLWSALERRMEEKNQPHESNIGAIIESLFDLRSLKDRRRRSSA